MNNAFKIIAIMLTFGVFVLQGCQTTNPKVKVSTYERNFNVCWSAKVDPDRFSKFTFGLDCENIISPNFKNSVQSRLSTSKNRSSKISSFSEVTCFNSPKHCTKISLCLHAVNGIRWEDKLDYIPHVKEAKRRKLDCGVGSVNKTVVASKAKTLTYIKRKSNISSAELLTEIQKRKELERKLLALEAKQEQKQLRIDTDTRAPLLEIVSNKTKGRRGTIKGIARDNVEVAEVTVNDKTVLLSSNGKFKYSTFVPTDGIILNVQATDKAGLTSSKSVSLKRNNIIVSTSISFDRLNPLGKKVKVNTNALALIIGVEDYKNTNADALYADKDAKMFRDFAAEKLGISENRIKILLNDSAGKIDITRAIKTWLLKRTISDKTDIYVFFAGHGLATDDGKGMYLLPYDGVPDLLEDSAIQRKELFAHIQATKPRSVTVFLDTCYSGGTRNQETLVANLRPIIITPKEQSVPSNFTVLSAAKGTQTSQSLEEVKHGLFSYYTMLGMEGGADSNNDNKITAKELYSFIKDKVERQSQFRQTPQLQGNKDRVLVQFN